LRDDLRPPLIELRSAGIYCADGDFYIDPWRPVGRAVITHGHSDHARPGSASYLCAAPGAGILKARLGEDTLIQEAVYGEPVAFGSTTVTFFPAGHILGSAQVRVESRGYSWVVSGDYKLGVDSTCAPFEPVRCHGFVTEATFALPIYHWAPDAVVFAEINRWWEQNRSENRASVLYGYSLGKAQRLLAGVDASIGPIFTHGAVERLNDVYRAAGVALPATTHATSAKAGDFAGALVVAPPGMNGSPWVRRFGDFSTAMASGWMQVRGHRRRRAVDRGFVVSDHADWPGLLRAIGETGAETVWVTHGTVDPLVRWLRERGVAAEGLATQFAGDEALVGEPAEA
jgi:putative mRNA 3-end processing factor